MLLLYFILWEPGPWVCTADLSVTTFKKGPGLSIVTLCHRCWRAASRPKWICTWRKDSCSLVPRTNPARGRVPLLLPYNMIYTKGEKTIMKPYSPLLYQLIFTLLFIQVVSTNIISVQYHYQTLVCETTAGNVSSLQWLLRWYAHQYETLFKPPPAPKKSCTAY